MLTKNDDHSKQAFENQLKKIEQHLAKRKTRYLTGDTLCCFDCELMTRLQHIRVAGKFSISFRYLDPKSVRFRQVLHRIRNIRVVYLPVAIHVPHVQS